MTKNYFSTVNILENTKPAFYQSFQQQLAGLLEGETDSIANLANTSALLFDQLENINWAGFYLLKDKELVLGPFQGKPACVRIPIGKGVCGTAAEQGETLIVEDVHQFDGHIACDIHSKSEIVVPLFVSGRLVGVLDIDSPLTNRFDDEDAIGLEAIVKIVESSLTQL